MRVALTIPFLLFGCGDFTLRVPPPERPAIVRSADPPDASLEDEALSEEFVLDAEDAQTTLASPTPPVTEVARGQGHFRRIPNAYRQRLGRRDAADAEPRSNSEWPQGLPHICGTGSIQR